MAYTKTSSKLSQNRALRSTQGHGKVKKKKKKTSLESKVLPAGVPTTTFDRRMLGPFTCIVAGPTGCGKSFLVFNILRNLRKYVYPAVDGQIIYCYGAYQKQFEEFKDHIEFHSGLLSRHELIGDGVRDTEKHHLLIIDDLIEKQYSELIRDIFTKGSHHQNMSVFFMTQNVFMKGENYRTTSLNSQYMLVFKNPRDMSQFSALARQLYPRDSGFLISVYNNELHHRKHVHLHLDFKQGTPEALRVRGPITDKYLSVFVSNKNLRNLKKSVSMSDQNSGNSRQRNHG